MQRALDVVRTENLDGEAVLKSSTHAVRTVDLKELVETIHVANPLLGTAVDDLG